jgi:transmembrane sensor
VHLKKISSLIEKYFADKISPEEYKTLKEWYDNKSNRKSEWILEDSEEENLKMRMFSNIKARITIQSPVKRLRRYRIVAAASMLILLSAYLYFEIRPPVRPTLKTVKINNRRYKNDIAPGGNKAVLTLADGSQVVLDNTRNGASISQADVVIRKEKSGQITYDPQNLHHEVNQINSISVPKGGQYQVILSDGTRVWLNAASSLKYPTCFSGKERNVELLGEAYFEVAPNKDMPFHVKVNNMEVEVLGTHFNIMAYPDEQHTTTTLLEGSVKVIEADISRLIVPGQQALLNKSTGLIHVQHADIDQVMAWKKGYYLFKSENIKNIMRELDRWYNIDVTYTGSFEDKTFSGKISRFKNISAILQLLELTEDVHFKIEGRRVTVMP